MNNISFFFLFFILRYLQSVILKRKGSFAHLNLEYVIIEKCPPPHNTSAFLAGSCFYSTLLYSTVGRNSLAVTRECVMRIADGWEERILYYVCVCAFRSLPLPSPQLYVVAVVLGGRQIWGIPVK